MSALNMVWECPRCGAQVGQADGVKFSPPTCAMGHQPIEMEQRAASRWGRQFEDDDA